MSTRSASEPGTQSLAAFLADWRPRCRHHSQHLHITKFFCRSIAPVHQISPSLLKCLHYRYDCACGISINIANSFRTAQQHTASSTPQHLNSNNLNFSDKAGIGTVFLRGAVVWNLRLPSCLLKMRLCSAPVPRQ